jgi:hypothetical protein
MNKVNNKYHKNYFLLYIDIGKFVNNFFLKLTGKAFKF